MPYYLKTVQAGDPDYDRIERFDQQMHALIAEDFAGLPPEHISAAMLGFIVRAILADTTITDHREAIETCCTAMRALFDNYTRTH